MARLKSILIICLLAGILYPIAAQERTSLRGTVLDKKTKEPVIGAAVHLKEPDKWAVSNEYGNFEFKNIYAGTYEIEFQCLGYGFRAETIELTNDEAIIFFLSPISYDMEEVNVMAKKGRGMATSTTIGTAAIDHIQATGLNDILQLVPGNIVSNPNLSKPQQITIREIGNDVNSAMGTSIIMDNAPISNNANLQSISTTRSGKFSSVAGAGVDLRQIATDNIESVEVIKGIPSVLYGNLTSGAVHVKTKTGYSPFQVRIKTDPRIKQLALTKGIKLPSQKDYLNFSFDYLSSVKDVTSKYEGFDRLTGQVGYKRTFMEKTNPLVFNVKLDVLGTIDNEKTDPDALILEEEYESKEHGARLNIRGKWQLNKKFLSAINYTFSTGYTHQESYQKIYRTSSGGVAAISISTVEGENEGMYLPTEQLTELTVDGKPLNAFSQLTFMKTFQSNKGLNNKTLAGFEYHFDKNYGEGQLYDIENPPFISNSSSRPRAFKDIPGAKNFALYVENKISFPVRTTKLSIQLGARLNNFQPHNFFGSETGYFFEPRFNLEYDILNKKNNALFTYLTFNLGIGKNYKAPSIYYLYPDKAYYDFQVLDYYTSDPATRLAVFYSVNNETSNPKLQPAQNAKKEIGFDFCINKVTGSITAFSEKLENGFQLSSVYVSKTYTRYITDGVPAGTKPNISVLPTEELSYFISYRTPTNTRETLKKGIEYSFDMGKINPLYTSIRIDGAYLHTTRTYNTNEYFRLPSSGKPQQFPYYGVYPAGKQRVSERLNSNFRMVTQVPQLRLILTTTLQFTWFDKYYYPEYEEAPLYLIDHSGNVIPYTEEMKTDPDLQRFYNTKTEFYYDTEILPPLFLANIKLSKEIEENMKISVFVNNFFNYRPMHQLHRTDSYIRRNPRIYFGAELKLSIK